MTADESHPDRGYGAWRWGLLALVTVGLVTAGAVALSGWLSLANLAFLFLLPVIAVSGRHGLVPGLLTATGSAVAFNFFLVPPRFTLHVTEADNVVTLAILFAVALAVSHFAGRLQMQAALARKRADESEVLEGLTLALGQQADGAAMRSSLADTLAAETGCSVTVFDGGDAIGALSAASPIDLAAARWALAHGDPAGRGAATMGSADSLFVSTGAGDDHALLVRLWRGDTLTPVPPSRLGFVQQLADRCGEAIERLGVTNARRAIEAREAQDAMRDALLASFSHDMRTPLTTVTSGLSGLAADPENGDALAAAQDGAGQLERLFANLVDLARIRAGAVSLTLEPVDLTDSVSGALDAVARQTGGRAISVTLPEAMPLVRSDARLLHHMLVNLLDNACKHTPPGTALDIVVSAKEGGIILSIQDHGPGLAEDGNTDLFAAFARGQASDRTPGSGLGLAIVAGFARALGIAVSAANRADGRGAVFSLHFPQTVNFDTQKAGDA